MTGSILGPSVTPIPVGLVTDDGNILLIYDDGSVSSNSTPNLTGTQVLAMSVFSYDEARTSQNLTIHSAGLFVRRSWNQALLPQLPITFDSLHEAYTFLQPFLSLVAAQHKSSVYDLPSERPAPTEYPDIIWH